MTISISRAMMFRLGMCLVGLAALVPVSAVTLLAMFTPITASGFFYLVGGWLFTIGAMASPLRRRRLTGLMLVGLAWLAATAAARIYVAGEARTVMLTTLPSGGSPRWLDRLVHEQDLALFGTRVAGLTGAGITRREYEGAVPALKDAYDSLEAIGGTTASPGPRTYLLLQRPAAFDAVIVEPPGDAVPQTAVIYLHGFLGNQTVQAWLFGQAVREVGALTVCPSVWFVGDWWNDHGEETVRRTIEYLRGRGILRIYLAGLSNGAIGTSRLARRFRRDLVGLILISGGDPRAPDVGLPLLAIHGTYDERFSVETVKKCAENAQNLGNFREFEGDHLLLAKRAVEVQAALVDWLGEQEAAAAELDGRPRPAKSLPP